MKLFLKGDRCYMAKCPIETGRSAPGVQNQRRRKVSDYGVQLREKQRLRRMYGLREGQFRLFFDRASRMRGVTGEKLLQLLEMRLDNVVYRLGFAPSRRAARQLVRHGHMTVDGKKVDVPSMILKPGNVVQIVAGDDTREFAAPSIESAESRGIVAWLAVDKKQFKGEVKHVPTREEIALPFNEQLIVELYSK